MSDLKQELTAVLREIYAAPGPIAGDPIWLAERLLPYIQQRVDAAVQAEREGCAERAHDFMCREPKPTPAKLAAAIRSGEKP